MASKDNRIGLFGGSFDPIHTGHLILAEMAADFAELSRVFFLPTAVPPHKETSVLTGYSARRHMVELAIAGNPRFELSFLEGADEVSYTFESVLHFKNRGYGPGELHLLIGSDSLEEMASWRNPEIIFENATIVTLTRPGFEETAPVPAAANLIMLDAGNNSISSSEIRRRVRDRHSIRYLVPRPVELFIEEHSLYRDS